ncbi:Sensor protein ZraS (fragment) [Candidatus Methylobacter favarea]|uniref:Sensor protein ZraS n=1 Tax=Candidatus Methylobacter favarea TaxID=2707345 RepID=A0A8S0WSJ5_9GAMM
MPLDKAQQLDWIHDLYRLGQSDLLQNNANEIFNRILRHIVKGFNAGTGSLALYQGDDNSRLSIVAGIGLPEECMGSVIAHDDGIIGWVIKNRKPLLLKGDVTSDPRFHSPIRREQSSIPSTAICWPLQLNGRVIGALSVNSVDEQACYTEDDLEFGRVLVNLITLVIDNARLHHEKEQRIEQYTIANKYYMEVNQQLEVTRHRLEQSDKRLNDILDSLDSVVWSVTPSTFAPFYLNRAAEDVYGYPVSDFFVQPGLWLDIICPDDRDNVKNCLEQLKNNTIKKSPIASIIRTRNSIGCAAICVIFLIPMRYWRTLMALQPILRNIKMPRIY